MATLQAKPHNARAETAAVPPVLLPSPSGTRRRPVYVPVKNEPGVLMQIDKRKLHIDSQYQRRLNERLVARILANWSWVSCGTLSVSQRPGSDMYFLMDGQHRWSAAMNLPRVHALPCLKFELDTVRDEAIGFLATNTERRLPTLRDQFKALLVAGDEAAQMLHDLADEYSRTISAPSSGTTISCVSDCMRLLREGQTTFKFVFPVAAEVARGRPMTGRLLRGLHYLEGHMPRRESLTDEYWRKRLVKIGYDQIHAGIQQSCVYENNGNNRACATGILRVLNKGLRQPIEMRSDRPNTTKRAATT